MQIDLLPQIHFVINFSLKYIAFDSPVVLPFTTHFLYTNKTTSQNYFMENNEKSNTATKEASISDKANSVKTHWLKSTCPFYRTAVYSRESC